MRRKFFTTILIAGFLVAGILIVTEAAVAHPLTGTWTLNFNWISSPPLSAAGDEGVEPDDVTSLVINMISDKLGKFTTGDGGFGWALNPQPNVVLLIFMVGCEPIYVSKDFNGVDSMSGFMFCRVGGSKGTWYATKP